ncbi:MAG: DUF3500 domain-containing protein [Pseudomonadales bacterium]|nr:DUF3500 domain-containing protein [Pseudomonadales bacterium]
MKQKRLLILSLASGLMLTTLTGCLDSNDDSDASTDTSAGMNTDTSTDTETSTDTSPETTIVDYRSLTTGNCGSDTTIESVVCAANALMATLSDSELETLQLDWSDSEAKTVWSNLPGVTRNGLRFGDLSDESRKAAMVVARAALSDAGYEDFVGILAADDYLNTRGGGGAPAGDAPNGNFAEAEPPADGETADGEFPGEPPMGDIPDNNPTGGSNTASGNDSQYSSNNYHIAFIGTPTTDGSWMLQIGGHHMAYNITYSYGATYPTPNHMAAEPKTSFEINAITYAPVADEGNAMASIFDGMDSSELAYAYLPESYSDVLIGPDNGSGVLPDDYPAGSNRTGMLVSDMNEDQQALVIAAIKQWVSDYPDDSVAELLDVYTSAEAFADTYVAWAGDETAGVDVDVSGTYMRIDGPRLWIEITCQSGVVITGQTHYHTMFRDKTMDYGNSL